MQKCSIAGILILSALGATAQQTGDFTHSFSPQLMVRGEYLHGYQALAEKDADPGVYIAQRARLTYKLSHPRFDIVIAPQDVRIWGGSHHLTPDTSAGFSLAEGYGTLKFDKRNKLKIGRQIIQYDEHRIIGSLDWAMQSRRHDLLLFQHAGDSTLSFDVGLAWNQDGARPASTVYRLKNNYKTLQFLWISKKWPSSDLSALFLNNGFQFDDRTTVFNQTLGLNFKYRFGKLRLLAWAYYQTGKNAASKDEFGNPRQIRGVDLAIAIHYQPADFVDFSLGGEFLSGTSQDSSRRGGLNAFNPFYGTNHRFNGYMDYFFVGNHLNSVGLIDGYFNVNFQHKKQDLQLSFHYFAAAADVNDPERSSPAGFVAMKPGLGQEVDLTYIYQIAEGVGLQAGYSQFFGAETLRILKGGSVKAVSNWAYLMLLIRPGVSRPKTGLSP